MTSETIYTNKSLTNAIYTGSGQFTGLTGSSNVQAFTAPGTWTKPTGGYTFVRVECIGGGGGGVGGGGGGGGGAFVYGQFPYASYPGPQAVTVGSGGFSSTGQPSTFGPGVSSTFGVTGFAGSANFFGGAGAPMNGPVAGLQGGGTTGPTGTIHGVIFGGGNGAGPGAAGGSSVYGGGGGGGPGGGAGGPSIFGGPGGADSVAGTAPGGGGGSGQPGARGSVRVITF
jgi:hypothetical protein